MRRASLAPVPAGGDGGGAGAAIGGGGTPGGFGFSRLPMPQALNVATRPPPVPTTPIGNADGQATAADARDEDVVERSRMTPSRPQTPTAPAHGGRKESSVQVAVRVRPLLPKEMATRVQTCVETEGNMVHVPSNDKTFTFDHVFPSEASQKDLYEQVVQPLMDSFLQGYNVTVLAYGQTGSGKTYTMGNAASTATLVPRFFQPLQPEQNNTEDASGLEMGRLPDHEGVIPRFISEMFARLDSDKEGLSNQVTVSYLEIYGEDIHDLLDQSRGQNRDNLQVRESNGSVWVQGLTEIKVRSAAEAAEQMRQGCLRRITGSTSMNEHSSRSHAVYTIKIVRKVKKTPTSPAPDAEGGVAPPPKRRGSRKLTYPSASQDSLGDDDSETTIISKLTFVDLAGSERLKKTQAEGDRMKEGIQINVGLLALGNVITALGDERRRSNPRQHVSYRDSKLTRLLQDALGGNSRTLFIACVSPAESNAGETVNTLQYASRAKNIQNKAVKNVDPRSAELARSRVFIDLLRSALTKACSLVTGDFDPRRINVDQISPDPMIHEYLRKLEEIAWAIANGSSSNAEASLETARAMATLVAQRSSLSTMSLSMISDSSASSVASVNESNSIVAPAITSGGSSIHFPSLLDYSTLNLRQLCKVVEIIGLSLEMQEQLQRMTEIQTTEDAKITAIEALLTRKSAIASANEEALRKMSTWESEKVRNEAGVDRSQLVEQATRFFEATKKEIKQLTAEKETKVSELAEYIAAAREDVKRKQHAIQQLRESGDRADAMEQSSPMDILLQVAELKHRFGLSELSDASWALQDEEKEHAEWLDDDRDQVAFAPKFFPGESNNSAEELFQQIHHELQTAITEEDLHTSQRKKLRERASILQRILNGWAGESRLVTEAEFLASNEEQLRTCEEHIREIGEALRHRGRPSHAVNYVIEGIDSIDLAKALIRRLVDALYGQKRLLLANIECNRIELDARPAATASEKATHAASQNYEDQLTEAREKLDKEMLAAFAMVSPFSLGALSQEHEVLLSQRLSEAQAKIQEYEERMKYMEDDARQKDDRVAALESAVESMKKNGELSKKMERIEQLRFELGLGPTDDHGQIDKELQRYEESRAHLQEQIDRTYAGVRRLEAILQVDDPVDLSLLQRDRGMTAQLLASELKVRSDMLKDEVMQRVIARMKTIDSIQGLVRELQVAVVEDFRHSRGAISPVDLSSVLEAISEPSVPREPTELRQWVGDLMKTPAECEPLARSISQGSLDQTHRVFKALTHEKVKRVSEMEDLCGEIRTTIDQMEMSDDDVHTLFQRFANQHPSENGFNTAGLLSEVLQIAHKASLVDTGIEAFNRLARIRDILVDVRDSRANALSYVHSTLEEAATISHESLASTGLRDFLAPSHNESNQFESRAFGCCREALKLGATKLERITDSIDGAVRTVLLMMGDQLGKYGIDTPSQRISFFLGQEDTDDNPSKLLFTKYMVPSDQALDEEPSGPVADCLLAEVDPARADFARFFSPSYGTKKLDELKRSAKDAVVIHGLIQSAQTRLVSLQKIMDDYNAVRDMQKKMAEFSAIASGKERFKGNSKNFMEEEKTRKRFARQYPLKLAGLRAEVNKWELNESGEYDFKVLGEKLKNLILDMVKTDTNLMHLDLGIVDVSRQSARRASKTATGIASAASAATTEQAPNQGTPAAAAAAAAPRVPRPGSAASKRREG